MKHATFPIVIQKESSGGYTVINPLLAGCYSQGETLEEALANIKEATALCLEDENDNSFEDMSVHTINLSYA
jgi:predicted RNase H-like HicB family nuclease